MIKTIDNLKERLNKKGWYEVASIISKDDDDYTYQIKAIIPHYEFEETWIDLFYNNDDDYIVKIVDKPTNIRSLAPNSLSGIHLLLEELKKIIPQKNQER